MEEMIVHWTKGPVEDFGDCFAVKATYQMGEGAEMEEAYLCHLEEAALLEVSNHFKVSIEPFTVKSL